MRRIDPLPFEIQAELEIYVASLLNYTVDPDPNMDAFYNDDKPSVFVSIGEFLLEKGLTLKEVQYVLSNLYEVLS